MPRSSYARSDLDEDHGVADGLAARAWVLIYPRSRRCRRATCAKIGCSGTRRGRMGEAEMIDGLFSPEEFARQTHNKRSPGRAVFTKLDAALLTAHRAATVREQLQAVQSLLTEIGEFQDRYARLASKLRDKSLYQARSTLVAQLEQQAKQVLPLLQREDRFETTAVQLSQSAREGVAKDVIGEQEPITQEFMLEFALRKAEDGNDLRRVLNRVDRVAFELLAKEQHIKRIEALLGPADATWFAVYIISSMLLPPDGSTNSLLRCWRPNRVKQEVIRCLSPMVTNKAIAMALLRKKLRIVVVPRNRYLTDLPMFAQYKDVICRGGGRVWNSTRGVGDVAHGGYRYVACTEENLMGYMLDSTLVRHYPQKSSACPANHTLDAGSPRNYYTLTQWGSPLIYDEGYSTTIHEFAHFIHRQAMSTEDRSLVQTHYEKWRRGMTKEDEAERSFRLPTLSPSESQARSKLHRDLALHRIQSLMKRKDLSESERQDLADLMMQHVFAPRAATVKSELEMGWDWVDGPIGLTSQEKARRRKDEERDRKLSSKIPSVKREVEVQILGKSVRMQETESVSLPRYMASLPHDGSPACYASSHVEEYFAQVSCCWLEANGGTDGYTSKPRKNSQEWVRNNEPRPIVELLERLYGNATVPGTNPLSKPL